jgi:hypothetical protein
VETGAQALDVILVQVAFPTEYLRDDARGAKDIDEILLFEVVLIHKEL